MPPIAIKANQLGLLRDIRIRISRINVQESCFPSFLAISIQTRRNSEHIMTFVEFTVCWSRVA